MPLLMQSCMACGGQPRKNPGAPSRGGHHTKWENVYMHFEKFTKGKCRFDEINVDLCNKFREYLLTAHQLKHTKLTLHINSVAGYWSTFRAVLHTAYREHI